MEQTDRQWCFTVVRSEGLHFLRPEKSWRPNITVAVAGNQYETTLGCDGQNINLRKDTFNFECATITSRVEIKVYHRSQSKKKAKKQCLVASASHSLEELLKKQHVERKVDVRLQCHTQTKRNMAGRGKPQRGATVQIRIRPPSWANLRLQDIGSGEEEEELSGCESGSSKSSDTSMPPSPTSDHWHEPDLPTDPPQQKLRRRLKGYSLYSDEEADSTLYSDAEPDKSFTEYGPFDCDDDDDDEATLFGESPSIISRPRPGGILIESIGWIAASLLPQYTEKIDVPPEMTRVERGLSSFTMYSELKAARFESDYEKVFSRLQLEWTYVGGLLVALAAVDTAVFSISPDSIFNVDSYARSAIAASSMTSGLGIACDAWFLLRYNWAELNTFITRAKDVYDSYFFFSLSARVPAICMFLSAFSLMGFLGLVAYDAWPEGVVVVCFLVGMVMSLQFFVYGAHWCGGKLLEGGRKGGRGVARAVRRVTG